MYQVSSDIVKRVTAYAHEQAAYNLTDYMEEMYLYDISDELAFNLYRHGYIQTLLEIVDGTDENWAVSCKGPAIPLAGLLSGLKRRGYRHDILSYSPFGLRIRVQDVEFTFDNSQIRRCLSIGDFHLFWCDRWKEAFLDFLETIAQHSKIENVRPYFEKEIRKYRQRILTRDIMNSTATGIIKARLKDVDYRITLFGINEKNGEVNYCIETPWGVIRIDSPLDALDEALSGAIEEIKAASKMY